MFTFKHAIFFRDFQSRTGLSLTTERREALDYLLLKFEADPGFTMVRELAYLLATIRWETAHTFLPISEKRFNRATHPREWARQNVYWKTGYYGRGYVQLTWESNYRKAGQRLKDMRFEYHNQTITVVADTFLKNPEYVLQRDVSYTICSRGMREGWFTGRKLGQYIKQNVPPDYVNARRVVNGTDHARDIAAMANQFELLLRAAS
ncbi:hypothetical protein L0128_21940 [candidate division KSB1 bacterium]|nr:hypothetical protein [candidate division KSB1 bacterium]